MRRYKLNIKKSKRRKTKNCSKQKKYKKKLKTVRKKYKFGESIYIISMLILVITFM